MNSVYFVQNPQFYTDDDAFLVHLPKIKGKEELFRQLSIHLNFPEYFGFNWDALLDLFSDFNWINQTKIILVHDEAPELNDNDLRIYCDVVSNAIASWNSYKEGKKHRLEVVFPVDAMESLNRYFLIPP